MRLKELLSCIEIKKYSSDTYPNIDVLCLCHDSRRAIAGSVFVCKSGSVSDGHGYAPAAYSNGARVFIAERPLSLPDDALVCIVEDTAAALSALAQKFYGYPAGELKIIGITGTKGKTTLALSIYDIGTKYGFKMGYIGTNGVLYGNLGEDTANTTPDVLELQRILRDMANARVEYVVLEVSSQALWQKRIDGLSFYITVFTNLYLDHIGGVEHPTFEHYRDCKRMLFADYKTQNSIINLDSDYARYMMESLDSTRTLTVSAKGNSAADMYAENLKKVKLGNSLGIKFQCRGFAFSGEEIFLPSPGSYSAENALEVIAACLLLGIDRDFITNSLQTLIIKGRCETVSVLSKPNTMFIIDYAHNGASLSSVLQALKEYNPTRLICLFGSVGTRTFGRRRELAEAAKEHADIIIVTSDNPAGEAPSHIINDICSHLTDCEKPVYKFEDRAEAIRFAVNISAEGDYVLLAGKGHENYQLIGAKKVPFSERDILLEFDSHHNTKFKL
ncbi:MAG: UDP-N-acetylmuramoyl-L-alanyl-D-glutamate--2,6-diaminopimelate ligase [Ruminococcaceae bacterium]|nr:UDP-N-acetylmuramoyl-L-alanyl-D-glutamate--2,6-diaminopimelate ligase [Oscillospiraceae bacterium]